MHLCVFPRAHKNRSLLTLPRPADAVFLPLLTHQSHPSETNYFPLTPTLSRRILLHSHSAAPYVASNHSTGHVLTIHSSGECGVNELELGVDWWATIGRWGTRYGTAAACWAVPQSFAKCGLPRRRSSKHASVRSAFRKNKHSFRRHDILVRFSWAVGYVFVVVPLHGGTGNIPAVSLFN